MRHWPLAGIAVILPCLVVIYPMTLCTARRLLVTSAKRFVCAVVRRHRVVNLEDVVKGLSFHLCTLRSNANGWSKAIWMEQGNQADNTVATLLSQLSTVAFLFIHFLIRWHDIDTGLKGCLHTADDAWKRFQRGGAGSFVPCLC